MENISATMTIEFKIRDSSLTITHDLVRPKDRKEPNSTSLLLICYLLAFSTASWVEVSAICP